ncbi:beta-glucosidase family protein [Halalkalicoccus ordinarius]|uniref:beta-glucosidase family protein n=1 Tax=Halalkalicoccus ordinarius TaxID=3116651 RepID=UPI00300E8AFC
MSVDVSSLVAELTLDEKIRLVHGAADPDGRATGYVPSIDRLGIPSLRLVDGPLGVRAEGESATAFPATLSLAAAWEPSLAREQGTATAREARAHDQDVLLAPGVNVVRVPHGGRNFEYYGEDPYLSSRLAVEFVEGVQSAGVIATVKHYVANNQETNRYVASAEVSERALRELYLPAFRATVEKADVGSVMTAYNRVNGVHMSEHRRLLRDVLKGEWGFGGYVVSDWWGTESTVGAAEAGLDLEMPGAPFEELPPAEALSDDVDPATIEFPDALPAMHEGGLFGEPLREAVESRAVDEALVDEKVGRLLRTMDRFGLFDDDRPEGALDTPAHRRLARRIAVEGTVLLKNDGILPLSDDADVALVGPSAERAKLGGGGSSEVSPVVRTSPLEGLGERAAGLTFERGVAPIVESSLFDAFESGGDGTDESVDEDPDLDAAVATAASADCAVVVVRDDTTEGEDRPTIRLPGEQDELVSAVADAANRTVVVLRTGGPVECPWIDEVDAVVETWYPGQADGEALATVLFGDADPGGRLPVTFGRRETDYPTDTAESFPGVDDRVRYDEDVFVGYRHFDREGIEPLFAFGHGLSYARFEYGDPAVERNGDSLELSIPVRNAGERSGTEVVQLYARAEDPPVVRPERELAAFAKLRLDPGERRRVSLTVDRDALARYDEDDGWCVDPGRFTLLVGRSSRDVRAKRSVEVSR